MKANPVRCRWPFALYLIAGLGAAVPICLPAVARAQTTGSITGLTVEPAQVTEGSAVTVTVQGGGAGGVIRGRSGDGDSTPVSGSGFPRTVTHTYQSPGNKTVVARRTDTSCRYSANAVVAVAASPSAGQPRRPAEP